MVKSVSKTVIEIVILMVFVSCSTLEGYRSTSFDVPLNLIRSAVKHNLKAIGVTVEDENWIKRTLESGYFETTAGKKGKREKTFKERGRYKIEIVGNERPYELRVYSELQRAEWDEDEQKFESFSSNGSSKEYSEYLLNEVRSSIKKHKRSNSILDYKSF